MGQSPHRSSACLQCLPLSPPLLLTAALPQISAVSRSSAVTRAAATTWSRRRTRGAARRRRRTAVTRRSAAKRRNVDDTFGVIIQHTVLHYCTFTALAL